MNILLLILYFVFGAIEVGIVFSSTWFHELLRDTRIDGKRLTEIRSFYWLTVFSLFTISLLMWPLMIAVQVMHTSKRYL